MCVSLCVPHKRQQETTGAGCLRNMVSTSKTKDIKSSSIIQIPQKNIQTCSFDSSDQPKTHRASKKKTQNISHFWSACINTGEGGGESFHVASRKKEGRWRPLQWLHSLARSFSLCRKSVCGYRWNRATGHFTFQLNSQNGMSLCPANQRRIYTPHLCIPNNHNYFHCSLLHQCMLPFYCFIHCRSIKKL